MTRNPQAVLDVLEFYSENFVTRPQEQQRQSPRTVARKEIVENSSLAARSNSQPNVLPSNRKPSRTRKDSSTAREGSNLRPAHSNMDVKVKC